VDLTLAQLAEAGDSLFPGLLGIEFESVEDGVSRSQIGRAHV